MKDETVKERKENYEKGKENDEIEENGKSKRLLSLFYVPHIPWRRSETFPDDKGKHDSPPPLSLSLFRVALR